MSGQLPHSGSHRSRSFGCVLDLPDLRGAATAELEFRTGGGEGRGVGEGEGRGVGEGERRGVGEGERRGVGEEERRRVGGRVEGWG